MIHWWWFGKTVAGDRYWVNDDADGDWEGTNNWSTSSGGAGGAATPTSSDAVIFDQAAAGDCALSANAECASLTMTAANGDNLDCVTHNLTVAGAADLDCAGGGETVSLGDGTISIGGNLTVTGISLDCETADLTCANVLLDGAGDFDFGSGDHEIVDFTVTGSGDVDYGSATITTSGDFDNSAMTGTTTEGTSTWVFTKSSGTIKTNATVANRDFYNLTISDDTEHLAAGSYLKVNGKLTVDAGKTVTIGQNWTVVGEVENNGTIADGGSNTVSLIASAGTPSAAMGTITVNELHIWMDTAVHELQPGTFAVNGFEFFTRTNLTYELPAGTFDFDCDVKFDVDAAHTLTLDCQTNNPTISITGDVIDEIDGTLTWQKSTNGVTLNGSGDQDIDFDGSDIGPLTIASTGGTVTFSGAVECDSFTGTSGDADLNGQTITVNGNVTANKTTGFRFWNGTDADMSSGKFDVDSGTVTLTGASGNQLAIDNLDFDLASGVTGTATYCDVSDSTCTYVDDPFDATDATNSDEGGNVGWSFVVDTAIRNTLEAIECGIVPGGTGLSQGLHPIEQGIAL